MPPTFKLKSTLFGSGFQKESVLEYIGMLQQQIREKETELGISHEELPSDTLKSAKFGGGFDKKSVLLCIDFLQSRLIELQMKWIEHELSDD